MKLNPPTIEAAANLAKYYTAELRRKCNEGLSEEEQSEYIKRILKRKPMDV